MIARRVSGHVRVAGKGGSGTFAAGIVLDTDGVCIEAAPILRWCVGKHYSELRPRFRENGWSTSWHPERRPEPRLCPRHATTIEPCPLCGKESCVECDGYRHGDGRCVDDGDPLDADPHAWGSD